jgi:1,4-dihydroxy-2-naphthoate polyprenyltransferase
VLHSRSNWFWATRPQTLVASTMPVVIATAMAYSDGVWHWPSALAAFVGAALIQIGTNLANDYFDYKQGVDAEGRKGPPSCLQAGALTPMQVKWFFITAFTLAGFVAAYLTARAGWPALVIGVIAIILGVVYSAGKKSLAALGLGDLFVLLFFGPVACAGTYYVQSFEWNLAAVVAGLAPGFLSAAIIIINNLRDIETDTRAGRRTFAIRFGRAFTRMEYLFCVIAGCLIPVAVFLITGQNAWSILASLVIFLFLPNVHAIFTSDDGEVLNEALARTAMLLTLYSFLYSITWLIP